MNAIETEYKGYRFRSRLEARWAVFFDCAGIAWQYEPEGFEADGDLGVIRYLPDFYLTDLNVWVEVKPECKMTDYEQERLSEFLRNDNCPLGFYGNWNHEMGPFPEEGFAFMMLGNIPEEGGVIFHRIVTQGHEERALFDYPCYFGHGRIEVLRGITNDDPYHCLLKCFIKDHDFLQSSYQYEGDPGILTPISKSVRSPLSNMVIQHAYKTARQARFEHGETPVIPT